MHDNFDAHKSPVYSLASHDQNLYSSANKSIKIWDLNNMRLISEISESLGQVKAIKICKERNILIASSDKSIMIWNL